MLSRQAQTQVCAPPPKPTLSYVTQAAWKDHSSGVAPRKLAEMSGPGAPPPSCSPIREQGGQHASHPSLGLTTRVRPRLSSFPGGGSRTAQLWGGGLTSWHNSDLFPPTPNIHRLDPLYIWRSLATFHYTKGLHNRRLQPPDLVKSTWNTRGIKERGHSSDNAHCLQVQEKLHVRVGRGGQVGGPLAASSNISAFHSHREENPTAGWPGNSG